MSRQKRTYQNLTYDIMEQGGKIDERGKKETAWSTIRTGFSLIGAGFLLIGVGLLTALDSVLDGSFFLLSLFFNWIKVGVALTLSWLLVDWVYSILILHSERFEPFNPFRIVVIIVVSVSMALLMTIRSKK